MAFLNLDNQMVFIVLKVKTRMSLGCKIRKRMEVVLTITFIDMKLMAKLLILYFIYIFFP